MAFNTLEDLTLNVDEIEKMLFEYLSILFILCGKCLLDCKGLSIENALFDDWRDWLVEQGVDSKLGIFLEFKKWLLKVLWVKSFKIFQNLNLQKPLNFVISITLALFMSIHKINFIFS